MSASFDRISSQTVYEGKIATVRLEHYRYDDGGESDREIVGHDGAVGIVAHDDEHLYLVRQPREAVGSPDLLELPAGKLDEEGEEPLDTAKRELAEESGKAAEDWEHLKSYWSSAGFSDERVHVFLATGLRDVEKPAVGGDERIHLGPWRPPA